MINKKLLLFFAALSLLFACNSDQEGNTEQESYIPENSVFVIKTEDLGAFLSKIDSLAFFRDNQHLVNEQFVKQLRSLSRNFSGPSLICFTQNSTGDYSYTYINKTSSDLVETDTIKNKAVKTYKYASFSIKGYDLENVEFYVSSFDGNVLASNSRTQLETVLKKEKPRGVDETFSRMYAAADPEKTSVFINHKLLDPPLDKAIKNAAVPFTGLTHWSVIDLDFEEQNIYFNGISGWEENDQNLLQYFQHITPQPNLLATVTPGDAAGFYSFTYSDFNNFYENLRSRDSTGITLSEDHLLNYTREAGIIFTQTGTVLALATTDAVLAKEANTFGSELIEKHRNIPVLRFMENPGIAEAFTPLIANNNFNYFAHLDDFVLLSDQLSEIKAIISAYLNKHTLSEQDPLKAAIGKLANSSSLLMVANSAEFKSRLVSSVSKEYLPEVEKLQLESYPIMALQFVVDNNFAHLHGVFSITKGTTTSGFKKSTSIEIEANVATAAFLVENHDTNEVEVAFQDENNILYLASAGGEIIWKKQMDSRILGRIHQVDLFKNGNLQLAFTTQNALNVLDRNGNTVQPFPIKFKDDVTKPLSVFDYDTNRNYRFVVTQGRELLMYDNKGRIVTGFGFGRAASEIAESPKHIRMGNKDYIVFSEAEGKLNILSRQGKSRVDVKEKFNFSENGWYAHQNHFVSVNSEGEIIRINQNGMVTREKSDFQLQPYLTATEKVLVLQLENNLKINNSSITLDFGLYTKPEIFELNSRTYVSITDTQAQKVYVFNENGNLLEGFPVYGSSPADLYSGENNSIVIGVKGEENSVILYRVQEN